VDLTEQLNRLSDFPGAVGRLNFSGVREISRPIVTLTVDSGKITRLEAVAPKPPPPKGKGKSGNG